MIPFIAPKEWLCEFRPETKRPPRLWWCPFRKHGQWYSHLEGDGGSTAKRPKTTDEYAPPVRPPLLPSVVYPMRPPSSSDYLISFCPKAFSLEEAVSALSASLKAAEKKLVQVDDTSSQGICDAERRISVRVQTVVNAQMAVNEEVFAKLYVSHAVRIT